MLPIKKEHIILTISVLTSRKEEQVRRCLDSLEGLRREIPSELIVVDTSEDPHMRDVLSEYTDHIVPFHWINDFSAARNAGLREARGEWFLYLDDDEYFIEDQDIIDFFRSGSYKKYNGATYIARNYFNPEGTRWNDMWTSRMAKIVPGLHFTSLIHEYMVPNADKVKGLRSIVEHYGYAITSEKERMEKFERNHTLLLKMIEREPDEIRWRSQIMMEYWNVGETDELFRFADECLEHFRDSRQIIVQNAYASFMAAKLMVYEDWVRTDLAYDICVEALADKRTSRLGQAYFRNHKGMYAMERGDYREAEEDEKFYLENHDYFQQGGQDQIMQSSVAFIMNTYDESYQIMAYTVLICSGLKQGNPSYLKRYYPKLQLESEPVYSYPRLPEILVEAMAESDSEKIFVRTLKELYKNERVWQQFELAILKYVSEHENEEPALEHLLRKAEIDSSFLKLYILRKKLSEPEDELNGEPLVSLLQEYVEVSNAYYEEILDDDQAARPADYRATLLLQNMLNEEDIRSRFSMLKSVVETYPPLSEAMKRYAEYLGTQISEKEDQDKADKQIRQMAEQILPNVYMMVENGMIGEARGIIQQIRQMLPDDEEILALEKEILRIQEIL